MEQPQGRLEIETKEESSQLDLTVAFNGLLYHQSAEPALRSRVGHYLEAICQDFLYSFSFRISHAINNFHFYIFLCN